MVSSTTFFLPLFESLPSGFISVCTNLVLNLIVLHIPTLCFQTIALLNIYRNPQNSAQSADGLTCTCSPATVPTSRLCFFAVGDQHSRDVIALVNGSMGFHKSPHVMHSSCPPVPHLETVCQ